MSDADHRPELPSMHEAFPRVTDALSAVLDTDGGDTDLSTWIVVHANHAREFTPHAIAALRRIQRVGIPVLGQSVLLRGVNDCVHVMKELVHKLVLMRVRPYYIYQCDLSMGLEHFRTPVSKGIEIIEGLRGHTSGYAVPTFVVDAPGGGGKIPVTVSYTHLTLPTIYSV